MNRVRWARTIGVIGGLILLALGAAWLLSARDDPAAQTLDTLLVGLGLIVPGILFAAPWSRVRPRALWYALFIALVVVVPAGTAEILLVNTWAAIHGAGGEGFALAGSLLILWGIQLPAIWSLRPVRGSTHSDSGAMATGGSSLGPWHCHLCGAEFSHSHGGLCRDCNRATCNECWGDRPAFLPTRQHQRQCRDCVTRVE